MRRTVKSPVCARTEEHVPMILMSHANVHQGILGSCVVLLKKPSRSAARNAEMEENVSLKAWILARNIVNVLLDLLENFAINQLQKSKNPQKSSAPYLVKMVERGRFENEDQTVAFCECPLAFTGELCETAAEKCGDRYCQNGGKCFEVPLSVSFAW